MSKHHPRDFAHRCTVPGHIARAGSVAYAALDDAARGHAVVEHDSKRWCYRVMKGERRAFRSWLADVFSGFGSHATVHGSWPAYRIETH